MPFNILLVEDNIQKKEKILDFIKSIDFKALIFSASMELTSDLSIDSMDFFKVSKVLFKSKLT